MIILSFKNRPPLERKAKKEMVELVPVNISTQQVKVLQYFWQSQGSIFCSYLGCIFQAMEEDKSEEWFAKKGKTKNEMKNVRVKLTP